MLSNWGMVEKIVVYLYRGWVYIYKIFEKYAEG